MSDEGEREAETADKVEVESADRGLSREATVSVSLMRVSHPGPLKERWVSFGLVQYGRCLRRAYGS